MTVFNVTIGNMVNILVIAAGIGICGMNILQVSTGARLSKEATRYFQLFSAWSSCISAATLRAS